MKDVEAYFLDGCAVIWDVPWPGGTSASVEDYIDNFSNYIQEQLLSKADVYLVF